MEPRNVSAAKVEKQQLSPDPQREEVLAKFGLAVLSLTYSEMPVSARLLSIFGCWYILAQRFLMVASGDFLSRQVCQLPHLFILAVVFN